jgi:hypothetical protein
MIRGRIFRIRGALPRVPDRASPRFPARRQIRDFAERRVESKRFSHSNHSPCCDVVREAAEKCPRIVIVVMDDHEDRGAAIEHIVGGDRRDIRRLLLAPFLSSVYAALAVSADKALLLESDTTGGDRIHDFRQMAGDSHGVRGGGRLQRVQSRQFGERQN